MIEIDDRYEKPRGCGYRVDGGTYLVSGGPMRPCGRLPIPLTVCPTCGEGVRPCRGWRWVNGDALAATATCSHPDCDGACPMSPPPTMGECGMLWVGPRFYPTPEDFMREGAARGISRRIAAIPKRFVLGKTWVLLAHRKTSIGSGVFGAYRPTAIEYIVRLEDDAEFLEGLVKRGFTLVRVHRV